MTLQQTKRLAEIRARLQIYNADTDTSTWEATFFLELLEEKNQEIKRLQSQLQQVHKKIP